MFLFIFHDYHHQISTYESILNKNGVTKNLSLPEVLKFYHRYELLKNCFQDLPEFPRDIGIVYI